MASVAVMELTGSCSMCLTQTRVLHTGGYPMGKPLIFDVIGGKIFTLSFVVGLGVRLGVRLGINRHGRTVDPIVKTISTQFGTH